MSTVPQVCVGAIVIDDGRLLLIRRGHGPAAGEWSVPGGRVEPMELIEEAVVRELAEETGLEGVCGDLVGVVELLGEQGEHHYVVLDYHVHLLEASEPTAGSDAAEAMWVSLADVAEMRLVDGLAEFLHEHGILETIV